MMEVMRGDRRGLESSAGGAGRVLRAPVSKGGILPEVPWEMRGAEGSGVDRARATGAAASFGGCSFESAHGERETWEPGRCLRPFLQVHRVRALSPRRAERRGSSGERRMSLLPSLQASPRACEALQLARSFRGASGLFQHRPVSSKSWTLSPEAWSSPRHHAHSVTHLHAWVYL